MDVFTEDKSVNINQRLFSFEDKIFYANISFSISRIKFIHLLHELCFQSALVISRRYKEFRKKLTPTTKHPVLKK